MSSEGLQPQRLPTAFPEKLPVTGFHHGERLDIYSGGTVRDLHPIILFSKTELSALSATQGVIQLSKVL